MDLKNIFMAKNIFPAWASAKEKGDLRTSGQPIKHWGSITDRQLDFNKYESADNQMSQYIFIRCGVPSAKSL